MLHEEYPALPQAEPLVKDSFAQTAIPLTNKVSLFATLETISQPVVSVYPQTMEQLGQNTGYLLYRTSIEKDAAEEKLRVIDGRDRLQLLSIRYIKQRNIKRKLAKIFTLHFRKRIIKSMF